MFESAVCGSAHEGGVVGLKSGLVLQNEAAGSGPAADQQTGVTGRRTQFDGAH